MNVRMPGVWDDGPASRPRGHSPHQSLRQPPRRRRSLLSSQGGGNLRFAGAERRRQEHHPQDIDHAAPPDLGPRHGVRRRCGRTCRPGAADDRVCAAGAGDRPILDRPRTSATLRRLVSPVARRSRSPDPRSPGAGGSGAESRHSRQDLFRRDEAQARYRLRPAAQPESPLSRRADARSRRPEPPAHLGLCAPAP